ncbi:hypothetical protein BDN72DRAFT_883752 [Pluteus cervinus]|uniref:Uncharacterized protein n=1 Tax=Pluteus cervinus TaxID=181527 RepID=A0ACD3A322_9AGAR|nr:hypothetical protein BDN72DRAFT_883752 [Pluteus cervinus]
MTRFGTIYWAAESILRNVPAFVEIVRNPALKIKSEVLVNIFSDEYQTLDLSMSLKRLIRLLRPLARAIQCLEAKNTNPSDVYLYWLAIVAQLYDTIEAPQTRPGGSNSQAAQAENQLIEDVRRIVNSRFAQLINRESSLNIYIAAFYLDPAYRDAKILDNPNPLTIPSLTITKKAGRQTVLTPTTTMEKIGVGLQAMLRKEYGNIYALHSSAKGKEEMESVGSAFAEYTPGEALDRFRKQFQAYFDHDAPFHKSKRPGQSTRDWWMNLLATHKEEVDVLAKLVLKIYSGMPVSMVEERAMSVITWINSDKRNRQKVSTVANHLQIRQSEQINAPQKRVRKSAIEVRWRDMKCTVNGEFLKSKTKTGDKTQLPAEVPDLTEDQTTVDPLQWLDDPTEAIEETIESDGFVAGNSVDLTSSFLLDILADDDRSLSAGTTPSTSAQIRQEPVPTVPAAEEWGKFRLITRSE